MNDVLRKKILEQMGDLCSGPLYNESKQIAEKMVKFMGECEEPGKKVTNGQLTMIGAMVSAMLMSHAPDGEVEEVAIDMHMHFLQILLKAMKNQRESTKLRETLN